MVSLSIEAITKFCSEFVDESELNLVQAKDSLRPDLVGLRLYEHPLIGVAAADDPLFEELRHPGVVGPQFRLPREWLDNAVSVISFFLPHSPVVIETNRIDPIWLSDEWLHAHNDGTALISGLGEYLVELLMERGFGAVHPSSNPRFEAFEDYIFHQGEFGATRLSSNWSERHVGYVAGLGTFGLSAAFISRAGAAGRMGSIVTNMPIKPTSRDYERHDEYCIHCGACLLRCRMGALSRDGKDKKKCARFVKGASKRKYAPRDACAKCYVAVPCETAAPGRRTGN